MQWEVVSIVLLIVLVVALLIFRKFFAKRVQRAAAAKGRELGVDLESKVKLSDLGKLSRALLIADPSALAVVTDGVAQIKRVAPVAEARWNLRVANPDDIVFELSQTPEGALLRVVSSREALGTVFGGGDWLKVIKAVTAAAAARGVAATPTAVTLERSAAPINGDHVWTLANPGH